MELPDDRFETLITQAVDSLPPSHRAAVQNIAIIMADEPTPAQKTQLLLRNDQLLLGLYEGVPLPRRQGTTPTLPDKITLFKHSLLAVSHNETDLQEQIRHTVWHELAHYFGLDHDQIHALE